MKFIDLFAGLGGFHRALSSLGHDCVFASELDPELRDIYARNFPSMRGRIFGDIRESKVRIGKHDILCAGFPCQPFSKSGLQAGFLDKTRGTLFHEILEILDKWEPKYVILENVGNFERHDQGRTWKIVRESLEAIGYFVQGTEHIASGGHGLISPHHLGYPPFAALLGLFSLVAETMVANNDFAANNYYGRLVTTLDLPETLGPAITSG